jgi:hypothetical protein
VAAKAVAADDEQRSIVLKVRNMRDEMMLKMMMVMMMKIMMITRSRGKELFGCN